MANSTFRVIIGGGGISGLTLANALEQADIDYILLEARNEIAPKVGASIGIFANGGRILDQMGCFDPIEKVITPLTLYHSRYPDGSLIYTHDGAVLAEKRFDYPTSFLERETVLQVLYNNLKDKSKIKTQKRITKVDHNAKEVIVLCEDGTAISGDILVGCDGVNSKVRDELWRVSEALEPTAFDSKDKGLLSVEYNCLFGISAKVHGVAPGEVEVNHDHGRSSMVIGGTDKVYWFLFKKLDQICLSAVWAQKSIVYCLLSGMDDANSCDNLDKRPNIPRYSRSDAEAFAAEEVNSAIKPGLTFGDIWKKRDTYTLVPLEEAQLKRWSWGRIACVGDGVHKMTPNLGAGGNCAIETSAALANEIQKMVKEAEKGKPSFEIIKAHLGNYQKIRETRITAILEAANGLTRIHALNSVSDKLLAYHIMPFAGDMFTNLNCDVIQGAVRLEYLPVPDRSRQGTMSFNPSQGVGYHESRIIRAIKALPFLAIFALASYLMIGDDLPPLLARASEILENGVDSVVGKPGRVTPLKSFYGIDFLDSRFAPLAACFASFQFVDVVANWQSFYFLVEVGTVYGIVLIESARRANVLTLASVPLLLGWNMQFMGIGVLMSLWCFSYYVFTPIEKFAARDMRLTDIGYTASVLPLMLLFHYIPNYLSYATWLEPQTRHSWEWIWQLFPVFISVSQFVLRKTVMPNTIHQDRINNVARDLPTIRFTIRSLCAISTLTWWYTLYSAPVPWSTLFIPNLAPGQVGDAIVRKFLQCDEIFSLGACCVWLLYLYGDMKKVGMMEDSWFSIFIRGAASLVAFGPGATVGLGWLYREDILATKWHKDALVPGKN